MTCHPRLERRVHRNGRVIGGAVHDRLTVNIQIDQVFCPLNVFSGTWRDQDMFAGPPVLCIHRQEMDRPVGIVDQKPFDVTDEAIGGLQIVTGYGIYAAQMGIIILMLPGRKHVVPPSCIGVVRL